MTDSMLSFDIYLSKTPVLVFLCLSMTQRQPSKTFTISLQNPGKQTLLMVVHADGMIDQHFMDIEPTAVKPVTVTQVSTKLYIRII